MRRILPAPFSRKREPRGRPRPQPIDALAKLYGPTPPKPATRPESGR